MTQRKINSRKKTKTVTVNISKVPTEVTLIAKRGLILYGVCLTADHRIAFLRLLETPDEIVIDDMTTIRHSELLREQRLIDNHIQVSVSCFVSNAFIADVPDIKKRVEAKVRELVTQIPKTEIFNF